MNEKIIESTKNLTIYEHDINYLSVSVVGNMFIKNITSNENIGKHIDIKGTNDGKGNIIRSDHNVYGLYMLNEKGEEVFIQYLGEE